MGSACTPSMSAEPTPGPMTTGRRCTREAGKLSEPNTSRPPGRRSTTSGARGPPRSCPSFGERPGKKAGAPETPEGEEEAEAAAAEEEDYDEEEEEEEEYDEEEE